MRMKFGFERKKEISFDVRIDPIRKTLGHQKQKYTFLQRYGRFENF